MSKRDKPVNEALRQNITKEMLAELEETFNQAADSNGVIPVQKLPLALKSLGMTLSEQDESKMAKKTENNEEIDLDKFIEVVLNCMKQPNWAANEMNEVFNLIDKDGNANITPDELRSIFGRLGENLIETELEDQLREFDIDGDLQMAVAEFYKMVASTRGSDFVFDDNIL